MAWWWDMEDIQPSLVSLTSAILVSTVDHKPTTCTSKRKSPVTFSTIGEVAVHLPFSHAHQRGATSVARSAKNTATHANCSKNRSMIKSWLGGSRKKQQVLPYVPACKM